MITFATTLTFVETAQISAVHSLREGMRLAELAVAQMRREGTTSEIRHIAVRHVGGQVRPDVYSASYYDPEQGLTESEIYAARVHDWHAPVDAFNRAAEKNRSKYGMGLGEWNSEWGPEPKQCPMCPRILSE